VGTTRIVASALLVTLALAAQIRTDRPAVTEQEIAEGKRLFQGHCGSCHGPEGRGSQGPNLARPNLRHASNAAAMFRVIDVGLAGTEMPRSALHDREVWKVVAYVESIGRIDPEPLPGDPRTGRRIYDGKGNCVACHWLDGAGGRHGPDLTNVGARRSIAHLREALVDPAASTPENYLLVTAVRSDGRKIQGLRLNEDPFTIQLRDFSDEFHSLRKADLAELTKRTRESSMPSYLDSLSPKEIDDLVSYMATLKGEQ